MSEQDVTPGAEAIVHPEPRTLDLVSLKALAHPLRVEILNTLFTYGAFTASGLAERLGESSGATSYHLRQLEKHGFVREVEGKGTGRERWWERMPGGLNLPGPEIAETDAGRAATDLVAGEFHRHGAKLLDDFVKRGFDTFPKEWMEKTNMSSANLRLTLAQMTEVNDAWEVFLERQLEKFRGLNEPGSRVVHVQFNLFPVLDAGEPIEGDSA